MWGCSLKRRHRWDKASTRKGRSQGTPCDYDVCADCFYKMPITKRYFQCPTGHGLFVRENQIAKIVETASQNREREQALVKSELLRVVGGSHVTKDRLKAVIEKAVKAGLHEEDLKDVAARLRLPKAHRG
eukprot:TRINITY_DN4231_c0_g1_i1.p1 TRINITY_DN4231_c0_g1~~TRINITY_DN4231_c0_g1_i1.p1  ORF type:complete len:130 (+),score=32.57 TRINITY_DN4231_c0_g1_i1:351-740(+)